MKNNKIWIIALAVILLGGSIMACDDETTSNDKIPVIIAQDNKTPVAEDFVINGTGTFTYDGSPKTVTVIAKEGKSTGAITLKSNDNTELPLDVGIYIITFNVEAAKGWNEAEGLLAGVVVITTENLTLDINETNNSLFIIFNLEGGHLDGNETAIVVFTNQNGTIKNLPVPQRAHYTFGGWFFEKNGRGAEFTTTIEISKDLFVFAKWVLIDYVSIVKPLVDTRLNGVFTGSREYSKINVYYDLKLTFDGTNKFTWSSMLKENDSAATEPHVFTFELEIDDVNRKFRRRLWSNPFDEWTVWLPFEFVDPDTLKIQWYDFLREPDILYKTNERAVTIRKIIEKTISNISDEETYLMMKQEEKQLKGVLP